MSTPYKIDEDLDFRLKNLASQRQLPAQSLVCEAVQGYLEREEARERFKQEALDSWDAYKANGKHLTGEEVRHWLKTWGTENETEIPACHE